MVFVISQGHISKLKDVLKSRRFMKTRLNAASMALWASICWSPSEARVTSLYDQHLISKEGTITIAHYLVTPYCVYSTGSRNIMNVKILIYGCHLVTVYIFKKILNNK